MHQTRAVLHRALPQLHDPMAHCGPTFAGATFRGPKNRCRLGPVSAVEGAEAMTCLYRQPVQHRNQDLQSNAHTPAPSPMPQTLQETEPHERQASQGTTLAISHAQRQRTTFKLKGKTYIVRALTQTVFVRHLNEKIESIVLAFLYKFKADSSLTPNLFSLRPVDIYGWVLALTSGLTLMEIDACLLNDFAIS